MSRQGRGGGWRFRFRAALSALVVGAAVRVLASTLRIRRDGGNRLDDPMARGESLIVVFWHAESLAIAWAHRHRGIAPLISTHADGEIMTRVVEALGYRSVRGSTARGGLRALLEMARFVEDGVTVALTPDGPRGPRHVFSRGAIVLAQRTGRPIIALRVVASRAWQLRSWDRYLVPKPFAKVSIRYSEPQHVRATSDGELDAEAARLTRVLSELGGEPNEGA